MRELLIRISFYVIFSIVYTILFFLAMGQRIEEWFKKHHEAKPPKRDPIVEHQKYPPHKH